MKITNKNSLSNNDFYGFTLMTAALLFPSASAINGVWLGLFSYFSLLISLNIFGKNKFIEFKIKKWLLASIVITCLCAFLKLTSYKYIEIFKYVVIAFHIVIFFYIYGLAKKIRIRTSRYDCAGVNIHTAKQGTPYEIFVGCS